MLTALEADGELISPQSTRSLVPLNVKAVPSAPDVDMLLVF